MGEDELKLKWAQGSCRNTLCYLSSSKICFSCDNIIRVRDVNDSCFKNTASPGTDISCMATIPFLGIIAVSDTGRRPTIHVFQYPGFALVSQMCRGLDVAYIAMCFAGMDYLVTLGAQPGGEISLWHWKRGQSLFVTSPSCCYLRSCTSRLSSNPSSWYQLCLEQSVSLTVLEIEGNSSNISISQRCVILPEDKRQTDSAAIEQRNNKRVSITSHCWISNEKIVVSCEDGTVMSVDVLDLDIKILYCFEDNVITSLAYNSDGLFLGKKDGCVLCVDISQHKFKLLETLNIGLAVKHLTFCPNFEKLTIVTAHGAVFSYELGSNNLQCVVLGDESPIVGICMLNPESRYCVTARYNGLLQVWCMATGKFTSRFEVDEEVQSLISSPSSATVLVSTTTGYLYFLSLANLRRIRIVNVSQPYQSSIEHVAFDNYGYYIAVVSRKEFIHIFGGQPSSGFSEVGCRNSLGHVIDMSLCTKSKSGPTTVVLLIRSDQCHRSELGDTLVKMDLPPDLSRDPSKYHFDVLGTLLENVLNIQTWQLSIAASKLAVHFLLGALIYSPMSFEIQAFQLWSKEVQNATTEAWMVDVSSSLAICDMVISPDHHWLATVDVNRRICLFRLRSMVNAVYETEILEVRGTLSKIAVSQMGNRIVIASENGLISCFSWNGPDVSEFGMSSPWILKFREIQKSEDLILKGLAEDEETQEQGERKNGGIEKNITAFVIDLGDNLMTLYLMLDAIYQKTVAQRIPESGDFKLIHEHQYHDEELPKLSFDNHRRLKYLSDEERDERQPELNPNEEISEVTVKALRVILEISSYDLKLYVPEKSTNMRAKYGLYHTDDIVDDLERNLKLIYITAPGLPLDVSELHSKEPKLKLLHLLNSLTYDLKLEFNERLVAFSKYKTNVLHAIREKIHRMNDISALVEIKEPFWESQSSHSESGLLDSFGIFDDDETNETVTEKIDDGFEKLPVKPDFISEKPRISWSEEEKNIAQTYEKEIENLDQDCLRLQFQSLKKTVENGIVEFDRLCGRMQELKSLCNFIIYDVEVQAFVLLLWSRSDMILQEWSSHFKQAVAILQSSEKPSKAAMQIIKEMSDNTMEFYEGLIYLERDMEGKMAKNCYAHGAITGEKLYEFLRRRPHTKTMHSKNPFQPLPPQHLSKSVLESELQSVNVEWTRPKGVNKSTWKTMCESKVWKFATEQVLEWLTVHICNTNGILLKWKDFELETKIIIQMMTSLISKLSEARQKFEETAEALLRWNYEMEVVLMNDLSPPTTSQPPQISSWQAIRKGNFCNKKLQKKLEKLEEKALALDSNPNSSESPMKVTGTMEFESKLANLQRDLKYSEENISTSFTFIKPIYNSLMELKR